MAIVVACDQTVERGYWLGQYIPWYWAQVVGTTAVMIDAIYSALDDCIPIRR